MRDRYYDRKKKILVVCLAGARSLLRPEKKSSSHLSGGCAIVITAGARSLLQPEKKVLVVCLAGARSLLRPEKKGSSRQSGGCTIVITTGKKNFSSHLSGRCAITTISTMGPIYANSSDFYAKLNVSNLNVTNLY